MEDRFVVVKSLHPIPNDLDDMVSELRKNGIEYAWPLYMDFLIVGKFRIYKNDDEYKIQSPDARTIDDQVFLRSKEKNIIINYLKTYL
jgi:hypothetical protein